MKRILLIGAMVLTVCVSAIAGINEKLSATTQLLIAERDGLISLDMKVEGPKSMSRAPLLRTQPVERIIAAPEMVNGVEMVSAFIHINPNATAGIESMGVVIQERFNDFVTAMVPVARIEQIANLSDVKEVNVARKVKLTTNMARSYSNTDDVLNFTNDAIAAGLPKAFRGTGVVVGVIDQGIDFQHAMFKDANGNSRIKRAYVGRGAGTFTAYTSVGSTPTTDYSSESHGTHTSTTAAGSEITVSGLVYGGMAPEADLVLVGCGQYMYNTNIANGIKYIFEYADSQNKPAVCSISLGTHLGPHDGTGELASAYAQYAGNKANHIIVNAAGNEAGGYYGKEYCSGNASSSTPFTTVLNGCYYPNYGYGTSYLNRLYNGNDVFYARTANKALACKLHVVNTSDQSVVWTSNAITSTTSSVSGITTYFDRSPTVTISRNSYNNKYYVQLYFNQVNKKSAYNSSNYALAVSVYPTSGSCFIDGWDVSGDNAFGSMTGTHGGYTFVAGSDDCSIVDEASSEDVISVGAYCTKRSVKDYRNTTHTLSSFTLKDITYFSSYQAAGSGPTGIAKPDICAPGATIVAGINHYDNNYMNNELADYGLYLVYNNGASSLGNMDGTSMATPCAAGIIALYLQAAKYVGKTLNTAAIRDVFANSAIQDNYTGKKNFGPNGKIDALEGIKYILGEAITIPELSVNPTSLTFNGEVGSTVTKTFTVTGSDLMGDVNLSVSGTGFSVSPTTISAAAAMAGATVTVSFAPTTTGTKMGTVTLSTPGVEDVTVSLTGTATQTPTLTVDPASLSFSTMVDSPVTKTFVVTGANLTDNVLLSVTEGSDAFSIDKFTLLKNSVSNGVTITVTYDPFEAGSHEGVVTVTSSGLTRTVALNGTATDAVRSITVDPASLSFEAVVGQTLTKTFHLSGSNLNSNVSLTLNDANGVYTISRTSATAARVMSGIDITVTYKPTTGGSHNANITISGGGADPVTVALNGTASIVKYAPVMLPVNDAYVTSSGFRAEWTDETPAANVVSYTLEVTSSQPRLNLMATETGGTTYRLITGITPDKFYDVMGLEVGTYYYHVKAVYVDGTESEWSNIQEVTLSGHGFQLGDVDHDGSVSIGDVTSLIDHILGGDPVCEICADMDQSGDLSIGDVTELIDYILSGEINHLLRKNVIMPYSMDKKSK